MFWELKSTLIKSATKTQNSASVKCGFHTRDPQHFHIHRYVCHPEISASLLFRVPGHWPCWAGWDGPLIRWWVLAKLISPYSLVPDFLTLCCPRGRVLETACLPFEVLHRRGSCLNLHVPWYLALCINPDHTQILLLTSGLFSTFPCPAWGTWSNSMLLLPLLESELQFPTWNSKSICT